MKIERAVLVWLAVASLSAGAGCIVEHERRNDDGYYERRDPPPPPPPREHTEVVVEGEYQGGGGGGGNHHGEKYDNLPNMGYLDAYLPPNWVGERHLAAGRYYLRSNHIHFKQGGLHIWGAGMEQTVIMGDVEAYGDGFIFSDLTVNGDFKYRGNGSSGLFRVKGDHNIKGINNRDTFAPH